MLIGLHGKKQAGKDTVYERLRAMGFPVERASFADLVYESAAAALGVTVAQLREWKNDPGVYIEVGRVEAGQGEVLARLHPRKYLQRYGTEAHRDLFGHNFWVEQVPLAHGNRFVVVTDVRFPNEAERVRRCGGAVVHVVGPPSVENAGDGHESEATLPPHLIDHVLPNPVRGDNFASLDADICGLLDRLQPKGLVHGPAC